MKEKNRYIETLTSGIFKENPIFVLFLGLCPTLGVTSSAMNGLAMGLAVVVVLACSNSLISLFKNCIPDQVRIPAYIMIIASLVTIVQMVMEAYLPELFKVLGLFIPLIVVNCIVLGRAESFASKNGVFLSFLDGIGSGLGFTLSLTVLGMIRELLGAGKIFGFKVTPQSYIESPAIIFVLAPGAFITIAFIKAFLNYLELRKKKEER